MGAFGLIVTAAALLLLARLLTYAVKLVKKRETSVECSDKKFIFYSFVCLCVFLAAGVGCLTSVFK